MMLRRRRNQPVAVVPERAPLSTWEEAVHFLITEGFTPLECPKLCRRKGDHAHLRHERAGTEVIACPVVAP